MISLLLPELMLFDEEFSLDFDRFDDFFETNVLQLFRLIFVNLFSLLIWLIRIETMDSFVMKVEQHQINVVDRFQNVEELIEDRIHSIYENILDDSTNEKHWKDVSNEVTLFYVLSMSMSMSKVVDFVDKNFVSNDEDKDVDESFD